jgi:hypothetical protein
MPNLSENTIIVIVGAILLLLAVIVIGRRLRKVNVQAGPISGTLEGGTPGANVSGNTVKGDLNEAAAEGENASITRNKVEGSGNKFTAKSGGA